MDIKDGIIRTKHPSYGQLQICRASSNKRIPLYGTSNECRETIRLSIHTSVHSRDLCHDWYYADDELIEVEMSPSQFAEAITSLNIGSGTPVTIKRIKGHGPIDSPPYKSDRDLFEKEFNNKVRSVMEDIDHLIDRAKEFKEQKSVTKKSLTDLLDNLEVIRREIKSNMPFVAKSFSEHLDNVVSSAKIEFDTFVESKIHSAGIESLRDKAPKNNLLEGFNDVKG